MTRRGTYCPFEIDYFPADEFTLVGNTLVHKAIPLHRATDGLRVAIAETVIPAIDAIAAPEALIGVLPGFDADNDR